MAAKPVKTKRYAKLKEKQERRQRRRKKKANRSHTSEDGLKASDERMLFEDARMFGAKCVELKSNLRKDPWLMDDEVCIENQ